MIRIMVMIMFLGAGQIWRYRCSCCCQRGGQYFAAGGTYATLLMVSWRL